MCWRCRKLGASTTKGASDRRGRWPRACRKRRGSEPPPGQGARGIDSTTGLALRSPILYDWACLTLPDTETAGAGRWLLMRRGIDDPTEHAYYLAYGPKETPVHELVGTGTLPFACWRTLTSRWCAR